MFAIPGDVGEALIHEKLLRCLMVIARTLAHVDITNRSRACLQTGAWLPRNLSRQARGAASKELPALVRQALLGIAPEVSHIALPPVRCEPPRLDVVTLLNLGVLSIHSRYMPSPSLRLSTLIPSLLGEMGRASLIGTLFILQTGSRCTLLPQKMGCYIGVRCWRRLCDRQAAGGRDELHEA